MSNTNLTSFFTNILNLPELSVVLQSVTVNDVVADFGLSYANELGAGGTQDILVPMGGVIELTFSFDFANNLVQAPMIEKQTYWKHEGIKIENSFVLPLWASDPATVSDGVWYFKKNNSIVAEIVQKPDYDTDPIAIALLLAYPNFWFRNFNPSTTYFLDSLEPMVGYIKFDMQSHLREIILSKLCSIGLHAFQSISSNLHPIKEVGCSCIVNDPTYHPSEILINAPKLKSQKSKENFLQRLKMYRFACVADDPFDALIRYWHVVEHFFDDLIVDQVTEMIENRPNQFIKKIQKASGEMQCAEELFATKITDAVYQEFDNFLGNHNLMPAISTAANIIGKNDYAFWNKGALQNKKKGIGSLLYSFRNAVAHRKENETWFDRLNPSHHQAVVDLLPVYQRAVYLLLQI